MKATVYYKIGNNRATRKIIDVEKNEPNAIVREFVKVTKYKGAFITHIKCGLKDYQWFDTCSSAF